MSEEVTNQPVKDQSQEPKTFIQRFQELEANAAQLTEIFKLHSNIFQTLIQEVAGLREQNVSLRNIMNAALKLGDESKVINTANVVAKYTETQAEMFKKNLEDAVKSGALKVVEEVKDAEHIVSFASNDVLFGYSKVSEFVEEKVREAMKSAKVGDVIEGLKVLGVYEPQDLSQVPAQELTGTPAEPQESEQKDLN